MRRRRGKLVRDGIVRKIERNEGRTPRHRILGEGAFLAALRKKLIEESRETAAAFAVEPDEQARERRIEELADLREVTLALCRLHRISLVEVYKRQRRKRKELGGFDRRIFLMEY